MKKLFLVTTLIFVLLSLNAKNILTIYTYDSMSWIEEELTEIFEKENNCKIKIVKFGDTGKVLSRTKLEKKNPRADLIIGLTPTLTEQAKSENLLEKLGHIENSKNIQDENNLFDKDGYVLPYDFGALAIIYNPENMKSQPQTFIEITKMKKKLIIQDPRTSTTGQDFLLWTIAAFGDNWKEFWHELKPAILTVSPGWSEAFAKFEVGEAPMMVSYATDGAYSFHNYQSTKYKALIPKEGGYIQKEGVGIVKGSKQKKLAELFINFMLSEKFQNEIPLHQWMFPVTDIPLPDAFKYAVKPVKTLQIDIDKISKNMETWLNEWEEIMQ